MRLIGYAAVRDSGMIVGVPSPNGGVDGKGRPLQVPAKARAELEQVLDDLHGDHSSAFTIVELHAVAEWYVEAAVKIRELN